MIANALDSPLTVQLVITLGRMIAWGMGTVTGELACP
jgi:hypothetical protein